MDHLIEGSITETFDQLQNCLTM